MSRRRQAEGKADERPLAPAITEEQTRVRELQPIDDPPTVPSYRDPIVSLDPDEAVTWNESMDEAWDTEPTRNRLRARRPDPEAYLDDPPTVTDVTRRQPRRPPSRPPGETPRPEPLPARPLPPGAGAPPVAAPSPAAGAAPDESPWILDEASFSSTVQPGERRLLPGDVLPSQGSSRPGSSRPPSMAAPAPDSETSGVSRSAAELHPAERRLMPPDSLPPGPASSMPPPRAAPRTSASAWPEGRGGTLSQITGTRQRSVVVRVVLAVAVMVIALAALVWLLL